MTHIAPVAMSSSFSPSVLSIGVAAALLVAACDGSPSAPSVRQDVTGQWRGSVNIPTAAFPTPLEMDLADADGAVSGAGGGVDCRYFATCGYFYSYLVTGSHNGVRVTLRGVTPERLSWVLTGEIQPDGRSMSGFGEGLDVGFPRSSWKMEKQ